MCAYNTRARYTAWVTLNNRHPHVSRPRTCSNIPAAQSRVEANRNGIAICSLETIKHTIVPFNRKDLAGTRIGIRLLCVRLWNIDSAIVSRKLWKRISSSSIESYSFFFFFFWFNWSEGEIYMLFIFTRFRNFRRKISFSIRRKNEIVWEAIESRTNFDRIEIIVVGTKNAMSLYRFVSRSRVFISNEKRESILLDEF